MADGEETPWRGKDAVGKNSLPFPSVFFRVRASSTAIGFLFLREPHLRKVFESVSCNLLRRPSGSRRS